MHLNINLPHKQSQPSRRNKATFFLLSELILYSDTQKPIELQYVYDKCNKKLRSHGLEEYSSQTSWKDILKILKIYAGLKVEITYKHPPKGVRTAYCKVSFNPSITLLKSAKNLCLSNYSKGLIYTAAQDLFSSSSILSKRKYTKEKLTLPKLSDYLKSKDENSVTSIGWWNKMFKFLRLLETLGITKPVGRPEEIIKHEGQVSHAGKDARHIDYIFQGIQSKTFDWVNTYNRKYAHKSMRNALENLRGECIDFCITYRQKHAVGCRKKLYYPARNKALREFIIKRLDLRFIHSKLLKSKVLIPHGGKAIIRLTKLDPKLFAARLAILELENFL